MKQTMKESERERHDALRHSSERMREAREGLREQEYADGDDCLCVR